VQTTHQYAPAEDYFAISAKYAAERSGDLTPGHSTREAITGPSPQDVCRLGQIQIQIQIQIPTPGQGQYVACDG